MTSESKARRQKHRRFVAAAVGISMVAFMGAATTGAVAGGSTAGPSPQGIDRRWADFDRDGFADLAIGAPFEDAAEVDAGVIWVMYGGPHGLDDPRNRVWYQDNPDVADTAEPGDHFGWSLATGRFNDDTYDDLAIGVPGEDDESRDRINNGGFNVLFGSATGLVADSRQGFVRFGFESGAQLGFALAAGQISGDTRDEVVAGAPGVDEVITAYGRFIDPEDDVGGSITFAGCDVAAGSRYGSSVVVGDIDDDPYEKIIVGAPFDDVPAGGQLIVADAGSVCIIGDDGDPIALRQGHEVAGTPETADRFGQTLAAGRLNSDTYDDLAIGTPMEDVGSVRNAGEVTTIRAAGTGAGLRPQRATNLTLNSAGMPGVPAQDDRLGQAIAIVDLGGPTLPDLVIGVPNEDVRSATDAGAVIVRYSGRPTSEIERWTQASSGIADAPEARDHFGSALYGADFDDDGPGDLVVGVPDEDVGGFADAGALNVIYGTSANGLAATGDQLWHQDKPGISGVNETGDHFGLKLP